MHWSGCLGGGGLYNEGPRGRAGRLLSHSTIRLPQRIGFDNKGQGPRRATFQLLNRMFARPPGVDEGGVVDGLGWVEVGNSCRIRTTYLCEQMLLFHCRPKHYIPLVSGCWKASHPVRVGVRTQRDS